MSSSERKTYNSCFYRPPTTVSWHHEDSQGKNYTHFMYGMSWLEPVNTQKILTSQIYI